MGKEGEEGAVGVLRGDEQALRAHVGQGVEVELVNGGNRRGFIHAVDPETGCVFLLVQSGEGWGMSVLMPHGISSWGLADMGAATREEAEAGLALLGGKGGALALGEEERALRRDTVMAVLRERRLAVTVDGEDLVLMGGLAFLKPPYTADACVSSNAAVLERVTALLENI